MGPNNSGKSNLFRALKFYRELINDSTEINRKYINIKDKYHQLNSSSDFSIVIEYSIDNKLAFKIQIKINHMIVYDRNGEFIAERVVLKKIDDIGSPREIVLLLKRNDKNYLQNRDRIREFLYDTTNNTNSNEVLEEISLNYFGPFFWNESNI